MFEKLIIRKTFYKVYTTNIFDNVYNILLYFLFNCDNIRFILFILDFNFYIPKDLIITKNIVFRIKY